MIIFAILGWSVVCDIATRIPAGPVSLSGLATLASGGLAIASVTWTGLAHLSKPTGEDGVAEPFMPERFGHRIVPFGLLAFAVIAICGLSVRHASESIQNVSVFVAFPAVIAAVAVGSSASTAEQVLSMFRKAAVAFTAIGLISVLHPSTYLYGARSFALGGLIMLAALIPHRPQGRLMRALPFILVAAIAFSLSRTATLIAVAMLVGMILRSRRSGRTWRALLLVVAAGVGVQQLITRYAPFRDRFTTGDNAYAVGGVKLNTSGRTQLWQMTYDDVRGHEILGRGPGTASELISAYFPNIAHPHNEYLRVLHDFGWLGLIPFVLGFLSLLRVTWLRGHRLGQPIHWSAFLGLLGVLAAAATDNVIIYPYVMLPLAILVGLSLAYPLPNHSNAQLLWTPAQNRGLEALLATNSHLQLPRSSTGHEALTSLEFTLTDSKLQ